MGAGDPQNAYETVNRIDYNWTNKTQLYGRFALESRDLFPGVIVFSPYQGFNTGETDYNQNYNLTLSHTFSPKLISTSKFVFNRLNQQQPLGAAPVGPTLYLTGTAFTQLESTNVALPGYSEFTPGNAIPFGGPQNVVQLIEDLSWNRRRHQFTFGGALCHRIQDNELLAPTKKQSNNSEITCTGGLNNLVAGQLSAFQAAVIRKGNFQGHADVTGWAS